MKIKRIKAENYKTYKSLDLDLNVENDKPIILVGGANGCGKTTLFDAIYHALYGMDIKSAHQFEEFFNAGVKTSEGIEGKKITLEIEFSGNVLGRETPYRLKRVWQLMSGKPVFGVELNMNGNRFVYGSGTPNAQRATNEDTVNKIIAANLPSELSNYFLFDAMKTSDLVKEEAINKLIMDNINSVMGFNKYAFLRESSDSLLAEKKAAKLENEKMRNDYESLQREKGEKEKELNQKRDEYSRALEYASENKDQYEHLKEGKNADDVTRDKIKQIEQSLKDFETKESNYRQEADAVARDMEQKVIFPKLADVMRAEIEVILHEKGRLAKAQGEKLSDEQIDNITHDIIEFVREKFDIDGKVNETELTDYLKKKRDSENVMNDKYPHLSDTDVDVLGKLVNAAYVNPFVQLDDVRNSINLEIADLPKRRQQLEENKQILLGTDYNLIEVYEKNDQLIKELKGKIDGLEGEIDALGKKIATYDYDIPQVPDPQYDMLCKLPDFFKSLSSRLLVAKKANIERMMKEQLNINLVVYAGYIGRVELSADNNDGISFKIYHKNGNEIYLSQLNAGAKQTVMQVLLKVLYELGDYDPPVMIDTVMGVLDKESRDVILEKYFPDLAHQTILLSTDTEITTEHDFKKIQAYVSHTYTLHRDKELQCTTVSEDYFGLNTNDF